MVSASLYLWKFTQKSPKISQQVSLYKPHMPLPINKQKMADGDRVGSHDNGTEQGLLKPSYSQIILNMLKMKGIR